MCLQYVEFFIERGVLGLSKEVNHTVLEYRGDPILPCQKSRFDSSNSFVVPVMPPTLVGICRLLQIYYVLKVIIFTINTFSDSSTKKFSKKFNIFEWI
jgi:hypothetical protein